MKDSKETILKLLPPNPVILDVGCWDGSDGLEFYKALGGELYAFDPISYDVFKGHGLNCVNFFPCAVGNTDTFEVFHLSTHRQSASMRKPKQHKAIWPEINFGSPIMVRVVRLDTVWPINKPIDIIWADLNGSEEDFIKGAEQTLKRTKYLYIEYSDKELYAGQISKKELLGLLPEWSVIGEFNVGENFGNLLLQNSKWQTTQQ